MLKKINKIFKKTDIKSIEGFLYNYEKRKKIVVYVPLKYIDKLTFDMGNAGAGLIGNYELCSFRIKGLGTYKPNSKAAPYKGKANKLSFEEEVRLEMECAEEKLDSIIDVMLASHPYEEVAYEIYDFAKRSKQETGYLVELKKEISAMDLISRFRRNILNQIIDTSRTIKKFSVFGNEINDNIISKSLAAGCDAVIVINKFSTILKII